jgi:hypothetical protein
MNTIFSNRPLRQLFDNGGNEGGGKSGDTALAPIASKQLKELNNFRFKPDNNGRLIFYYVGKDTATMAELGPTRPIEEGMSLLNFLLRMPELLTKLDGFILSLDLKNIAAVFCGREQMPEAAELNDYLSRLNKITTQYNAINLGSKITIAKNTASMPAVSADKISSNIPSSAANPVQDIIDSNIEMAREVQKKIFYSKSKKHQEERIKTFGNIIQESEEFNKQWVDAQQKNQEQALLKAKLRDLEEQWLHLQQKHVSLQKSLKQITGKIVDLTENLTSATKNITKKQVKVAQYSQAIEEHKNTRPSIIANVVALKRDITAIDSLKTPRDTPGQSIYLKKTQLTNELSSIAKKYNIEYTDEKIAEKIEKRIEESIALLKIEYDIMKSKLESEIQIKNNIEMQISEQMKIKLNIEQEDKQVVKDIEKVQKQTEVVKTELKAQSQKYETKQTQPQQDVKGTMSLQPTSPTRLTRGRRKKNVPLSDVVIPPASPKL